jgi:competence protein ComEA
MIPSRLLQPASNLTSPANSSAQSLQAKLVSFLDQHSVWVSYALTLLGVFVILYGVFMAWGGTQTRAVQGYEEDGNPKSSEGALREIGEVSAWHLSSEIETLGDGQAGPMAIDVSGAVVAPGLYYLPEGSRLADALEAAGGPSQQADLIYISRNLNLSQKVQDSDKIYVPFSDEEEWLKALLAAGLESLRGEGSKNGGVVNGELAGSASLSQTNGGNSSLISLNWASNSELQSLPGIGEKRAADIIAGRPYQTLDEVVDRGVITKGIWDKIADLVSL